MSDDREKLMSVQFGAINGRLDKFDSHIGRIFDSLNDINVVMERNTVTVEQHHTRSLSLERFQIKTQRRVEKAEKELSDIRGTVASLERNMDPIKQHVKDVSGIMGFFMGLPAVIRLITLIFGFIIGGYGVISIIRDAMGLLK